MPELNSLVSRAHSTRVCRVAADFASRSNCPRSSLLLMSFNPPLRLSECLKPEQCRPNFLSATNLVRNAGKPGQVILHICKVHKAKQDFILTTSQTQSMVTYRFSMYSVHVDECLLTEKENCSNPNPCFISLSYVELDFFFFTQIATCSDIKPNHHGK
jgi:hypothetical protein